MASRANGGRRETETHRRKAKMIFAPGKFVGPRLSELWRGWAGCRFASPPTRLSALPRPAGYEEAGEIRIGLFMGMVEVGLGSGNRILK